MFEVTNDVGDGFLMADFGCDENNNHCYLVCDDPMISEGAKKDAELCAALLTAYNRGQIKFKL
jgi:hypothetical protein